MAVSHQARIQQGPSQIVDIISRNGFKEEKACFLFSSLVLQGIHPQRIYENVNGSNKSVADVHSNNSLAGRTHLFTSSRRIPWVRLNLGSDI